MLQAKEKLLVEMLEAEEDNVKSENDEDVSSGKSKEMQKGDI